MVFNQGLAAGRSAAWHGMMAYLKDVGLDQGQVWVAQLEERGWGWREGEREEKIILGEQQQRHLLHKREMAAETHRNESIILLQRFQPQVRRQVCIRSASASAGL